DDRVPLVELDARGVGARVGVEVDVGELLEVDAGAAADARGADQVGLVGGDLAVLGAGDAHLPGGGRPVAGGGGLGRAIEHQLDGRLGLEGQLGGGDALHVGAELAAEAAAHVVGDALDVDVGDARLEVPGQQVCREEDGLGRAPDGQVVALPLGDEAVR